MRNFQNLRACYRIRTIFHRIPENKQIGRFLQKLSIFLHAESEAEVEAEAEAEADAEEALDHHFDDDPK